jgi:phosphotransferase system  glucose/maltose/N-acetylglucosamine-specific IIC component
MSIINLLGTEWLAMIFFIPMALLLIFGWLIKYKKVTWLISGYNTASKEKKAQYDIDKLCKHMGNFLFVLAGILFIIAVAILLFREYTDTIVIVGACVEACAIVAGIIYLNTGNRVKKE